MKKGLLQSRPDLVNSYDWSPPSRLSSSASTTAPVKTVPSPSQTFASMKTLLLGKKEWIQDQQTVSDILSHLHVLLIRRQILKALLLSNDPPFVDGLLKKGIQELSFKFDAPDGKGGLKKISRLDLVKLLTELPLAFASAKWVRNNILLS